MIDICKRISWKKIRKFFITESHKRFSFSNSSIHKSPVWQYFKEVAKKRTISPFLRTTIFRWCEKIFFSRRKGCGNFFIHLGRRWSYPIFNFKTNESSRNFCGGGSCYTWQWEFHHHTPRYGVVYTITLVVVPITSWFSSTSHQWHWKNSRII